MIGQRWARAQLQPFETALALVIVVQGVVALLGARTTDPLSEQLPDWLLVTFLGGYTLAGLAILFGLFRPRGDVEGGGLVLLALLLVARAILFVKYLGWGPQAAGSLAFSVCFVGACALRFMLLASTTKGQQQLTVVVTEKTEGGGGNQ